MSNVANRLEDVRARVARAAEASGRDPSTVRLVAVSKTQPASRVREAYAAGQRLFGENYAQELVAKATELGDLPDLEWHMVGHLQSNKAKLVAPVVTMVESVDSPGLARELGQRAERAGRVVRVLIEVNVAGELSKSGCAPTELGRVIDEIQAAPSLELRGLMTVPPHAEDPKDARRWFAELAKLRDPYGGATGLPELSMGMSHDFEQAIGEGATIVRIGTAIFGPRPAGFRR